jgi:serine/threonine protein phosphatase 1
MSRHLAIGDIHGCNTALETLIDFVGLKSDDTVVFLGDYVDRGPDTAAVLDFVINLSKTHTVIPLRGNHELMMLDSREKESWLHSWLQYGGAETLASYSEAVNPEDLFADIPAVHMDFLENQLLAHYECDTHFFVHANADADTPLDEQPDSSLYWRRYLDPQKHCSGKIMVCGHTIQESGEPANNGDAVCIDTWAYGEGWLTCLHVESETVWQANQARQTRTFALAKTDLQS